MSEEDLNSLRVKVAELCGLTNVHPVIVKNVAFDGDDRFCGITSDQGWIPDYLNDLNACAALERQLEPDQWPEYLRQLQLLTQSEHRFEVENRYCLVHATAEQRCRAFVAVMEGKTK